MSMNVLIIVLIVAAAIAFMAWNRRGKGGDMESGTPYAPPAAGLGAAPAATASAAPGPLASYDEYRRVSPSNMVNGKLTCNRCGSNLLRTSGGVASCTSCGASLYRA